MVSRDHQRAERYSGLMGALPIINIFYTGRPMVRTVASKTAYEGSNPSRYAMICQQRQLLAIRTSPIIDVISDVVCKCSRPLVLWGITGITCIQCPSIPIGRGIRLKIGVLWVRLPRGVRGWLLSWIHPHNRVVHPTRVFMMACHHERFPLIPGQWERVIITYPCHMTHNH